VSLGYTEDGSLHGSVLGEPKQSFELVFQNRDVAELNAAITWWTDRYPEKPFLYRDHIRGVLVPVQFVSTLRWESSGKCRIRYAFRIKEV
jgi:hypothetical protein